MNWKVIATIFIVLFIIENLFLCWGYYLIAEEEEKTNECYYNICKDYSDAWYEEDVCTCYGVDMLGEPVIAKTEYMK